MTEGTSTLNMAMVKKSLLFCQWCLRYSRTLLPNSLKANSVKTNSRLIYNSVESNDENDELDEISQWLKVRYLDTDSKKWNSAYRFHSFQSLKEGAEQASLTHHKPFAMDNKFLNYLYYKKNIKKMQSTENIHMRISLYDDQRYSDQNVKALGPDLAAAHFVVKKGGLVKFVDNDTWYMMKDDKCDLPTVKLSDWKLEAVSLKGTGTLFEGLMNLQNLSHLKFLDLSHCSGIDDFCMSALKILMPNLESLNISGCENVTYHGIACLYHLEHLTGVRISDMPHVTHKEIIAMLLNDIRPNLLVFGFHDEENHDNKTLPLYSCSNVDMILNLQEEYEKSQTEGREKS